MSTIENGGFAEDSYVEQLTGQPQISYASPEAMVLSLEVEEVTQGTAKDSSDSQAWTWHN